MSNKQLAAEIGLAPSSCLERVRRLTREGVLRGFHADVDPGALGVGIQAMVSVRLSSHTRGDIDALRAHLKSIDAVVAVYYLAGADDFLVHLAAKGSVHLRDIIMDELSTRPEIRHLETHLMFEHDTRWKWPVYSDGPTA